LTTSPEDFTLRMDQLISYDAPSALHCSGGAPP
jgi:hypothetical protein